VKQLEILDWQSQGRAAIWTGRFDWRWQVGVRNDARNFARFLRRSGFAKSAKRVASLVPVHRIGENSVLRPIPFGVFPDNRKPIHAKTFPNRVRCNSKARRNKTSVGEKMSAIGAPANAELADVDRKCGGLGK
jgi:hypothetical protein